MNQAISARGPHAVRGRVSGGGLPPEVSRALGVGGLGRLPIDRRWGAFWLASGARRGAAAAGPRPVSLPQIVLAFGVTP